MSSQSGISAHIEKLYPENLFKALKDQLLKFKGEFSKYAEIFLREEGNRIKNEEKEKELFQLLERYFAP